MSTGRFVRPDSAPARDGVPGRYRLRFGGREVPLDRAEILIGRAEGCHVVVNESLVSRRHARVSMDGGCPYVEDLGSANGTFVNQARLHGRALLFPGDVLFIGACEIEVVRDADGASVLTPFIGMEDGVDRRTPESGVARFETPSRGPSPSSRRRAAQRDADTLPPPGEPTTELEDFAFLGHLADKMFTLGRVEAARNILEGHLAELLKATRAGRLPTVKVLDTASRYAVKLAQETLDGRWVDAVIEMHLAVVRPLREETIQQLASLRVRAPIGSEELLRRYHERLRSSLASLSQAERVLVERVACLLP